MTELEDIEKKQAELRRLEEELARRKAKLEELKATVQAEGERNMAVGRDVRGDMVTGMKIEKLIQQLPSEPRARHEALERAYLFYLVEDTYGLQLSGIDPEAVAKGAEAELALAEVYTDLDAYTPREQDVRRMAAMAVEQKGRMERGEVERFSALAMLDRKERLALLGDPGSAKTTFVNLVSLCLAGERLGLKEANLARLGEEWSHGWQWPGAGAGFAAGGAAVCGEAPGGDGRAARGTGRSPGSPCLPTTRRQPGHPPHGNHPLPRLRPS